MAVLRFTGAGVVGAPTTLQIRVSRALPGRVRAGAPHPSRALSAAELRSNVHHFTAARSGPRSVPCTALVLSGVDLERRDDLAELVDTARGWGIARVVLHLGRGDRDALRASPLRSRIDEAVIGVWRQTDLADVAALTRSGLPITAVLSLDAPTLARLASLASALAALRPARVVLTWPLGGSPPPHAARVAQAVREPLAQLTGAGVAVRVKGLPVCLLGPDAPPAHRTRNRYYVDAEHQRDQALLFFPQVVRFAKGDDCRFCAVTRRCDGVPEPWVRHGLTGPLRPLP